MREFSNLLRIIVMLLMVLVGGTIGYMLIEKWSFVDSFYMTVITISTVGFGEVHPLSDGGKIFSTILIISGVGVGLYAFTNLIDYLVKGQISNVFGRRRMAVEMEKMRDHYIICGYDRIGQVVANALRSENKHFIILTTSNEEESQAQEKECLCLRSDPSDYETLKKAGIERAAGLLAVTGDDATNVFIIVSARKLRSDIFIVARASTQDSVSKLEAAGANQAINPYSSGGERIARIALYPGVTDFIERVLPGYGKELSLEEMIVSSGSKLVGKTVREAQEYSRGASILAISKKGFQTIAKPPDETVIESGDNLVILGQKEQLRILEGTTKK